MPILRINDNEQHFPADTILTDAIKQMGITIGHRCGGQAKCTTCRVVFTEGEPETMTRAEHSKLSQKGLLGKARLSCQILLSQDMTVTPQVTLDSPEAAAWHDTGKALQASVQPEAVWLAQDALPSDTEANQPDA